MRRAPFALLAVVLLIAGACFSNQPSRPAAEFAPFDFHGLTSTADAAPRDTVWLCRPGLRDNPCAGDLSATVVAPEGRSEIQPAEPAADPPVDCFYVYPTVSHQKGLNATLSIDPEEREVARAQAALFSKVCRVYAPIYPQLTRAAISHPTSIDALAALRAFSGVDAAFQDYLAHYNNGRGIVFIGHSQGAMMLIALLHGEVDQVPGVRKLLVSALLLGGNVTVAAGRKSGGSFENIPACQSPQETGCVVAYSSFGSAPPKNAYFGRASSPLNPLAALGGSIKGQQALCVNPASLDGEAATLDSYFPGKGLANLLDHAEKTPWADSPTPFVALPDAFTGQCRTDNGVTYLRVTKAAKEDVRPGLPAVSDPLWGLHTVDLNVALGNLVDLVGSQAADYVSAAEQAWGSRQRIPD